MIIITVVNCVNDPLFLQSYYTPTLPEAAIHHTVSFKIFEFDSTFILDIKVTFLDHERFSAARGL